MKTAILGIFMAFMAVVSFAGGTRVETDAYVFSNSVSMTSNVTIKGSAPVTEATLASRMALTSDISYEGTNVITDASVSAQFVVTLTNSSYLTTPTNAVNGQILKWWIIQGAEGNNRLDLDPSYVLPTGTDTLMLSTNVGAMDYLIGVYNSVSNNVHLTGLLLYPR